MLKVNHRSANYIFSTDAFNWATNSYYKWHRGEKERKKERNGEENFAGFARTFSRHGNQTMGYLFIELVMAMPSTWQHTIMTNVMGGGGRGVPKKR